MNENYYLVEVMCGHVGAFAYIPVVFPILAEDGREAAKKARSIPRVKHHNKYAILNVKKVSYDEYILQQEVNNSDAYLNWRETGCTDEYTDTVSERIRYMHENPFVAKRKKERSKRPDPNYRGSTMLQLNSFDLCEC